MSHDAIADQTESPGTLDAGELLHVPHRKRMTLAYLTTGSGARELHIDYGAQRVTFDEPHLFAFAEQLVAQRELTGEAAMAWGPGYAWSELRVLLEALLAEGILVRGPAATPRAERVPSPLPPSTCPAPRMWSTATCEAMTRELGGRAVEIGNLEVVIPAYRIAHPALDADDRQVGEASVFPSALRLDRPTEWRTCQYAGSRYHDDGPMNVTALKAMIKYWRPMMAAVLALRAELRQRLARSRAGWTVGDLHTFSRVVLAVPAYQLMRAAGAATPPLLHPVWSSVFRITDGIRMTTHEMLFLSAERTRRPEEPISADELYGFTERNNLFLSDTGVCAGPKAMIDQFFAVVFDGDVLEGTAEVVHDPEVRAQLAQLPEAVDYALLGLQVWGTSRSVWCAMTRAYQGLRDILDGADDATGTCDALRARLAEDWRAIERERLALPHERDVHDTVYADAYEQAWRGLRAPIGPPTLAERIAVGPARLVHAAAARQLGGILAARLPGVTRDGVRVADRVAALLIRYLREEQAILAAVTELQAAINHQLERPRPSRSLTVRDFQVLFALNPAARATFPYLLDTLEAALGFHVECTADTLEVTAHRCHAGNPAGGPARATACAERPTP